MKNVTVAECMSRPVTTITADAALDDALDLMVDSGHERLPVLHHGRLVGMVTRGDLLAAKPSRGSTLSRAEILTAMSDIRVSAVMSRNLVVVTPATHAAAAVALLMMHRISGMPVVDDGVVVGIVTETDFFRALIRTPVGDPIPDAPASAWMSERPVTISEHETAYAAHELMQAECVRRLPVLEDGCVIGIVTQGDLRRSLGSEVPALARFELADALRATPVRAIMSKHVVSVKPDTTLRQCADAMIRLNIGGLPVMRDGRLLGILTEHDVLRAIAASIDVRAGATH